MSAKDPEKIIGAFGLWPITQPAYNKIIAGKMTEDEITGAHIRPLTKRPKYKFWYLADIIVAEQYRKRSLSKSRPGLVLLQESLGHWLQFADFDDETIEVCAIAAGEGEGAKLLEAFGFVTAKSRHGEAIKTDTQDGVYLRSVSGAERARIMERIRGKVIARTWLDALRIFAGWVILIGAAGALALGLRHQYIERMFGIPPEDWILQMGGLIVCGLSLLIVKKRDLRIAIVGAGLIPIALKLLKIT